MITLPFLSLISWLLNIARTNPTYTAAPDVNADVTTLPMEMFLEISNRVDPETKRSLRGTIKAWKDASQLFVVEPADVEKIGNRLNSPKENALYQAILRKDTSAVKSLIRWSDSPPPIYWLELAVRYNSPQVAWVLLACETLEAMGNVEKRENLRRDAEMQQTETGLADLAQLRNAMYDDVDRRFFKGLILNRLYYAYLHLGVDNARAPTKAARIFGLQLAVRYGTNMNILMFLFLGTWDWDMDSEEIKEIVVAAKEKLPQTHLDILQNILQLNSTPEKRIFWKNCCLYAQVDRLSRDHDASVIGMQLAVLSGNTSATNRLLIGVFPDLKEKLIRAAAELGTKLEME